MHRLLLVLILAPACAASGGETRASAPAAQPAVARGGNPYNIVVAGSRSDADRQATCDLEVSAAGGVQDRNLPVRVVLVLEPGSNRLQVVSRTRGMVRDDDLPGWGMGRLCQEAIAVFPAALAQEPRPLPPPVYVPPPPPTAARPAPPPSMMPPPDGAPKPVVELMNRGAQAFARKDYTAALAAFGEANQKQSNPPLVFNMGVCFKLLGKSREALQYLQLYLDRAPQAPNRAHAEQLMAEIRRQTGEDE